MLGLRDFQGKLVGELGLRTLFQPALLFVSLLELFSLEQTQLKMNGDNLVYPNRFASRWTEWGNLSEVFQDYGHPLYPSIPPLQFAMDVSRMRNVACYISHSSSPNVLVQLVLYDHSDMMFPHLMLFAMENIPPLRELSLDYGVADEWNGKLRLCN